MPETKHFVNDGYGWACKHCRSSDAADASHDASEDADAQRIASNNADTLRDSAKDEDAQHGASASSRASATLRADALARFFREGESEEREARLSARTLARWTDDTRRALRCPRCGVEEEIGS